jgi:hypothetical protein
MTLKFNIQTKKRTIWVEKKRKNSIDLKQGEIEKKQADRHRKKTEKSWIVQFLENPRVLIKLIRQRKNKLNPDNKHFFPRNVFFSIKLFSSSLLPN